MYLIAEKYISGWKHNKPAEMKQFNSLLKLMGLKKGDVAEHSPSGDACVNVGYWRKSNHIHSWFVRNCQDGKDNCQRSYVDREKLEELLDICKEIAADHSRATDLLEPKGGFFFGSVDLDEWYFKDIDRTIEMLTSILKNKRLDDCDFYYRASW